jgi:hypothetical protein
LVFIIIFFGILSRILPLPPNFSPVIAITLFGSLYFKDKNLAFIAPISIILISDLILGFIPNINTYLPLIFVYFFSRKINSIGIVNLFIASLIFFLTSNFGVWILSNWYPKSFTGLLMCYEAALPFFRNTLLSTLLFGLIFKVSFERTSNFIVSKINS